MKTRKNLEFRLFTLRVRPMGCGQPDFETSSIKKQTKTSYCI